MLVIFLICSSCYSRGFCRTHSTCQGCIQVHNAVLHLPRRLGPGGHGWQRRLQNRWPSIRSGAKYDESPLLVWCQTAAFEEKSSPCPESIPHAQNLGGVVGNLYIREWQEYARDGGCCLLLWRRNEAFSVP